jgi:hypothetical protein
MDVKMLDLVLQTSAKARPVQGLLVVGMHRSGTSAVTRVLNLLGASLPTNLMVATPDVNPTGFWESYDIAEFNDALLAACGAAWDQVMLQSPDSLSTEILAGFEQRADRLLQRHFANSPLFALKDPRIGRLLPFWQAALRRNAIESQMVIVVRHPLEVAASLARRDNFSEEKSLYLWLRHMVDSLRFSSGMPHHIVVYHEMLQDWRKSMSQMQQTLGLVWRHGYDEVASALGHFLSADLRHHRHERTNMYTKGKLGQLAALLYSALLARASALPALVESLHQELLEIEVVVQALSPAGPPTRSGSNNDKEVP